MSEEYTPGDGARTLRWVPGMLILSPADDEGEPWDEGEPAWIRIVDDGSGVLNRGFPEGLHSPSRSKGAVADLTDRATFWLALEQLALRDGNGPIDLVGIDGLLFAYWKDPEALDRALWETRKLT